LQDSNKFL